MTYFKKWAGGVDDVSTPLTTTTQQYSRSANLLLCLSRVCLLLRLSCIGVQVLPVPPIYDMIISFIGAFLGILWVAGCAHALDNQLHEHLLVASLGATAVLLYGVMESKLAQPRNVIGTSGSFVSAQVICLCCHLHNRAILQVAAQLISSAIRIMQQRQRQLYATHPCIPALHIGLCQVIKDFLQCRLRLPFDRAMLCIVPCQQWHQGPDMLAGSI